VTGAFRRFAAWTSDRLELACAFSAAIALESRFAALRAKRCPPQAAEPNASPASVVPGAIAIVQEGRD
jgi:hypothetical protein